MEKIISFKSFDGQLFANENDCKNHEANIIISAAANTIYNACNENCGDCPLFNGEDCIVGHPHINWEWEGDL